MLYYRQLTGHFKIKLRSTNFSFLFFFQCHSPKSSYPFPLPQSPKDCSIHQCLFCCLVHRVIVTIFLNSIYILRLCPIFKILMCHLFCEVKVNLNSKVFFFLLISFLNKIKLAFLCQSLFWFSDLSMNQNFLEEKLAQISGPLSPEFMIH